MGKVSITEALAEVTSEETEKKEETPVADQPVVVEPEKQNTEDYSVKLAEYEERAKAAESKAKKSLDALSRIQKSFYEKNGEEEEPEPQKEVVTPDAIEVLRQERLNDILDDQLEKLSMNPDERKLIRMVYDQDIKASGTSKEAIRKDLEKAQALANAPRLKALADDFEQKQERKTSAERLAMNASASKSGSVGKTPPANDEPIMTESEKKLLAWAEKSVARRR